MTVHPVRGAQPGARHAAHPLSVVAFVLAASVAAIVLVAIVVFSVAFAVGGEDATADNWVGALAVVALVGGLLTSLGAFAVAVAAWLARERTRLLWLPALLFPALLAFLVLGEAFWWE